jgi:phosphatidylserine/phosphatidylglycerophosphate/cardiolipin synthase-like enzyme
MPDTGQVTKDEGDLRVSAYPGDNMVLLAMSFADGTLNEAGKNLAGFAIFRTVQGKAEEALLNRLNFDTGVHKDTTPQQQKFTPTSEAPIQKFRWVDVPPDGFDAPITYRVVAKFFTGTSAAITDGQEASVTVEPPDLAHSKFRVAFTRGYASSQAYADKFHNADIRPPGPKDVTFDTKAFQPQYEWLGADARKDLFAFIDDCRQDKTAKVDVFAYDLDEPDVIAAICQMGKEGRLRAILDNASLHTKAGAGEIQAAKLIKAAAGDANVKQGKFARFQHNKVFIKRDANDNAQKVLYGSMNFSLRGLYVQANNVTVVDDLTTAGYFAAAFDNAFENDVKAPPFAKDKIAQAYNPISATNTAALPKAAVSLSPHTNSDISLKPVADAIRGAQSSVFYAVMEPTGGGKVLGSLREIAAEPTVFSYGTVETDNGLAVQNPNGQMGAVTGFAFLQQKVPPPFNQEWSGGAGKHIHHKFVVVDFNDKNPMVFAGSSNLAAGGEEANGDSLAMIEDPVVASLYGIEAVRLFDHYTFREHMKTATVVKPLSLWFPGKPDAPNPWWKPYYDKTSIKYRDRLLFADLPLPADLPTVKQPDWATIDALAEKAGKKKTGGAASKSSGTKTTSKKKIGKKKVAKKKSSKSLKKKTAKKKSTKKKAAKKKTSKKKAAEKTTKKKAKKKAKKR